MMHNLLHGLQLKVVVLMDKLKEVLHLEEVLKEVVLVVLVKMVVVMEVVEVHPHY
tara:strand:- start:604 stop:768 length:165 start_codon:yes stop_codon:yes gene_type:complete